MVEAISLARIAHRYLAGRRAIRRRNRAFVRRSAADMKALLYDVVENAGRLEDFARIDRPQVCRRCNFRRGDVSTPDAPGKLPETVFVPGRNMRIIFSTTPFSSILVALTGQTETQGVWFWQCIQGRGK